jgi:ATPase subunit of ABC transporter with duplicated ATPase domains
MINIQNLAMHYGDRVLFAGVNFQIHAGVSLGIVGANGAGKSTLLKILSQEEQPTEGAISYERNIRISRLEQETEPYISESLLEIVLKGNNKLWRARQRAAQILNSEKADVAAELESVQEVLDAEQNYTADAEAARLLSGLGFSNDLLGAPLGRFSGGYRLRVMLARALFGKPDLLLLDEPTNHLDLPSIDWLIQFLGKDFRGVFVTVSHNRDFLKKVCNAIADVDFGGIQLYRGNYESYRRQRDLWQESKELEKQAAEKKKKEMQEFVERFRAKASKARQAQSRVKQIEKIEMPEIIASSRKFPNFYFQCELQSARNFLQVKGLSHNFDGNEVLDGVSLELTRGEKLAVVGANGVGKSTFLQLLAGIRAAQKGSIHWGSHVNVYYYPQDPKSMLHADSTVYEWLRSRNEQVPQTRLRSVLGQLLYNKDEVQKKIQNLSGGEAARLVFADILIKQPNVLLLDEPTNHLDLESVEALELALTEYDGSCILVSHDRSFLEVSAESFLVLRKNKKPEICSFFPEILDEKTEARGSRQSTVKSAGWHGQRKDLLREHTRIKKATAQLEKDIEGIEKKISSINELFNNNSDFSEENLKNLNEKQKEKADFEQELENMLKRWENSNLECQRLENEFPEILS